MKNGDLTDDSDDADRTNTSDNTEDIGLPTKKELRFSDDSIFTSFEDTGSDNSNSSEPIKFNQLNPRAKYISKLFTLIKPKNQGVWKKSRPVDNHRLDLSTSVKMGSSKRKRDDTSSEDEKKHHKKKVSKISDSVTNKKVNHKKQSHHLLSSSDEERSHQLVKPKHKKHKSKGNTDSESDKVTHKNSQIESVDSYRIQSETKDNTNTNVRKQITSNSGHNSDQSDSSSSEPKEMLRSEKPQSSKSVYENGCENDLSETSEHELNSQNKDDISESGSVPASSSSKLIANQLIDQSYREHNFTEEDEKVISKYSSLLSEKVLEENNVWILQCPNNVDCSSLVNQSLNFNGSCLLDAGEKKYEAYSHKSNHNSYATLAVPNHRNSLRLCRIPIAGHIILEETVKMTNKNKVNIPESPQCVKFPENLRVRHPLLGTDYENQPRTIARIGLSTKKKKKHTTRDNVVVDESGVDTSFMSSSNSKRTTKKKKKRTDISEDLTSSSNIDQHVEGFCETSRTKKKKHRGGVS